MRPRAVSATGLRGPRKVKVPRTVHVTTFEGDAWLATADASTRVDLTELDALTGDVTEWTFRGKSTRRDAAHLAVMEAIATDRLRVDLLVALMRGGR